MMAMRRRGFLWSVGCSALLAGCNFPTAMYFLMPEAKEPAECKKLASEDAKKEVKVVLWTYMNLDPRPEFIQSDRLLSTMLAEEIRRLSEENKEKVTVIKPSLVEAYKSRHPEWQSMDPEKVGRDFNADYVINLEIDKLTLYQPSSHESLFQGRAHIHVAVVDMKQGGEMQSKEFSDQYPSESRGGLSQFDVAVSDFREQFLRHVARRLAFYFVDHQKRSRVMPADD
jgi:hypothetical protein